MEDINKKFELFLEERRTDTLAYVIEQYENDIIDEDTLLRTINPALSRALSTFINGPKIEKAVRHYMKIRKDFKDNHAALRAASSETGIDYRTMQKVLIKMIDKGIVPKNMSISEEFEDLNDLLNLMNKIINELEK